MDSFIFSFPHFSYMNNFTRIGDYHLWNKSDGTGSISFPVGSSTIRLSDYWANASILSIYFLYGKVNGDWAIPLNYCIPLNDFKSNLLTLTFRFPLFAWISDSGNGFVSSAQFASIEHHSASGPVDLTFHTNTGAINCVVAFYND